MNYYERREKEAAEELRLLLDKPLSEYGSPSSDEFNPWDMLPLFGSYSSEFDEIALKVLKNLRDGSFKGESVVHEMFREILCDKGLCDYGTSPRVCFPTEQFKRMLPEYIEKWEKYSEKIWGKYD
jgi:hypothetical protein